MASEQDCRSLLQVSDIHRSSQNDNIHWGQVWLNSIDTSYKVDFVLETVRQMTEKHGSELKTDTLIHSDQGCQYTSTKFTDILNDAGLRQSMPRKGNCWDNAPQESFFGHMKDEIHVSVCDSHQKIQKAVLDWVEYYNNEQYCIYTKGFLL